MEKQINQIIKHLESLPLSEKVDALNKIRFALHEISPFRDEPVDYVEWAMKENVVANDYNPNKVAPPEMQLLEVSIINDGYTQPIVTFPHDGKNEVVDGFHRSRVGKESKIVGQRIQGYLPVVSIRKDKEGKAERIASTIRHNRARGKHQVSAMSEIVIELKNRNWANKRIANELGMDEDEILRLCQISGLEDMFKDADFNKAWVSDGCADDQFEEVTDETTEEDMDLLRIPLEKDEERIFHTFEKWEAVEYNFFGSNHPRFSKLQCDHMYKELLADIPKFTQAMESLVREWPHSCEHNLTNRALNRIAWLGQSALAYVYQIPSVYSSGFQLLTKEEQYRANVAAWNVLNKWLTERGMDEVTIEEGLQTNRQVELY